MRLHGVVGVLAALLLVAACSTPARAPAPPSSGSQPSAAPPGSGQASAAAPSSGQPSAAPPSSSAPSAPAAPAREPALQALVDAARQEGALNLVLSLEASNETVPRWTEGFKRLYGMNLDVRYTPGPPMAEQAARIAQEAQAGRTASSDVFIGAESHVNTLANAGALEAVDWASWAPNVRDPGLVAPGGVALQLATRIPGITYNTTRLSGDAVPATLQDLLKPQYKGRIASTPYAAGFPPLGSPEVWGEARLVDYVTKLADQIGGLIRCNEIDRLVSGEFDAFALDCGVEFRRAQARGSPIGHVIPSDAATLVYWYVAVPRHAAHPAAAKLWVDYLMSREGQDILFEGEHTDHHRVPGSHVAPEVEALQARGVKFTEVDVAFVQRTDRELLNRLGAETQRIIQKQ
ncbi:MAG TPA: ABC transporter substrate-binding protein [Chloroflexota bacterium]|jgi:iron(III) transport system substrate-binding protein